MQDLSFENGFSNIDLQAREMPCEDAVAHAFDAICNELNELTDGTALEGVQAEILTRFTSTLHSLAQAKSRAMDAKTFELKELVNEQDGSEIKSERLETLQADIQHEEQVIAAIETMRDRMAENHRMITGTVWTPARGSKTSRNATSAAILEARDFLANKERADALRKAPQGPIAAAIGTQHFTDVSRVMDVLDKLKAKQPEMVLCHGGQKTGVDQIAARWAEANNVPANIARPEFKKDGKRAAFARNDRVIAMRPRGVFAFIKEGDGVGIAKNLHDKAREAGIAAQIFKQN